MKYLIILFLGVITNVGCQNTDSAATNTDAATTTTTAKSAANIQVKNITVKEFNALVESNAGIVLDVRTAGEVAQGKIGNATHIDILSPDFKEKVGKLDKEVSYLVYCKVGARSASACNVMKEMGFTTLYNLKDGYVAWEADQK